MLDTKYFPHFLRINFPDVFKNSNISNEDAIEIGDEFNKYLLEKFKGKEEKLNEWCDITPLKVILNKDHPLKVNGYEPALVLHFCDFTEKKAQEFQNKKL